MPVEVDASIRDAVWLKLIGNISTYPLSVLTGATLDRLFNGPDLLAIVRMQVAEALTLGAAYGARVEQSLEARIEMAAIWANSAHRCCRISTTDDL